MNRSRIGRVVRVTLGSCLLVVVSSVVSLSAQGNPTLNEILAKLDAIIGMLTPTPPAGELTLTTSALLVPDTQQVRCFAVNLGTEAVQATIRLLNAQGSELHADGGAVPPGFLVNIVLPGPGFRRCEFTFVGTAPSIRANMMVRNLVDGVVTASVEAR